MVLYAYVIMENHIHMVIQADDVQEILSKFKSFTARQIIDYFKESNHKDILKLLGFFKLQHKKDRDFQLCQEGIHPVQIDSLDKMKQKEEYIHNNPVKKGYVEEPVHWIYSSARNYSNLESVLEISTDW